MRRLGIQLISAILLLSACGSEPTREPGVSPAADSVTYSIPDNINYNYRWSADPGIDLFTPAATAVRAYVESYYLTVRALTSDAGYPGYSKSVDENLRTDYGNPNDLAKRNFVGTQFQHLLWMAPTDDGWFATVCTGDYSVMREGDDGRFFNVGTTNIVAETVEISIKDSSTGIRSSEGPERAPIADVFGEARVVDHVQSARNQDAFRECRNRMPDEPSNRPTKWDLPHDAPYPTLAPFPGWPRYDEN